MTTNSIRIKKILDWHSWCETQGAPHTDQDQRNYITRVWGDLDRDIQETIHAEALAARAAR